MDSGQSLDEILKEIERDSTPYPKMSSAGAAGWQTPVSAGAADLQTHLAARPEAAPALIATDVGFTSPAEETVTDTAHILSSGLTESQRRLPKLDLRMIGGIVAVLILAVGVGSATLLTQQGQDLRQRAFEGRVEVTPIPQFQPTQPEEDQAAPLPEAPSSAPFVPIALAVVAGIGLFAVAAFIFWAFLI